MVVEAPICGSASIEGTGVINYNTVITASSGSRGVGEDAIDRNGRGTLIEGGRF